MTQSVIAHKALRDLKAAVSDAEFAFDLAFASDMSLVHQLIDAVRKNNLPAAKSIANQLESAA